MNSVSKHVTIATMNRPNKLNVSITIFNISIVSVPGEGYPRNVSCALE
jgi:hypothetical protein